MSTVSGLALAVYESSEAYYRENCYPVDYTKESL